MQPRHEPLIERLFRMSLIGVADSVCRPMAGRQSVDRRALNLRSNEFVHRNGAQLFVRTRVAEIGIEKSQVVVMRVLWVDGFAEQLFPGRHGRGDRTGPGERTTRWWLTPQNVRKLNWCEPATPLSPGGAQVVPGWRAAEHRVRCHSGSSPNQ